MVQVLSVAGFSAYFCQSGSLGKKMPYPSKRSPQRQANSPMGWAWNTSEPLRIASQWGKGSWTNKENEADNPSARAFPPFLPKATAAGSRRSYGIAGSAGQSGKQMLAWSFSGFDPLQACPITSGQGSRSQPGEKLRLLCCEFFRRENAFLVQFGQPLDFGEEVRFLGTVGPIRLAGRRHPWFRSLGLRAVHRGDRQS